MVAGKTSDDDYYVRQDREQPTENGRCLLVPSGEELLSNAAAKYLQQCSNPRAQGVAE